MKMLCPRCGTALPPEAVNIATDLALCPECGTASRASACVVEDDISQDVLRRPPPGTWLRQEADEIVVGTTRRSKAALFLAPFTVVWSGFSLYGIYGTQILKGRFNLLQSLFGIPFLIGTAFLLGITIYALFGRQEWRLDEDGGVVFDGVGRNGRRRRFAWKDLTRIRVDTHRGTNGASSFKLVLEGASPKVEVALPEREDRQQFIANALRYYHQEWRRRN